MCFHNHPSGDPFESPEDREVTKRLAECGKILGIELIDHVIIGEHRFVSLREKGCISSEKRSGVCSSISFDLYCTKNITFYSCNFSHVDFLGSSYIFSDINFLF